MSQIFFNYNHHCFNRCVCGDGKMVGNAMLLRGINEHGRRIRLVNHAAALISLKSTFLQFYFTYCVEAFIFLDYLICPKYLIDNFLMPNSSI